MAVSFECKAQREVCERVEERIRSALERAGFSGEAEIRVVVGRPGGCVGACVVYNTESDENVALFSSLASIFAFEIGDRLRRRGASCKLWLADGVAALLAASLLGSENPGFVNELERAAGGLAGEDVLEERFGFLALAGPGMIVPSGGPQDLARAAAAALEYLGSPRFRLSAARAVESRLERAPSTWEEALEAAESLCRV